MAEEKATTEEQKPDEQEDYSKQVSTFEVTDNRVVIISPRSWLLLSLLSAVVVFLIVWGIAGKLTTRVESWGIISGQDAQLLRVDAPHNGIIRRVLVEAGSFVQTGDPLLELLEVSEDATRHFQLRRVHAPQNAKIITLTTEAGRHVAKQQVLLRLQTPARAPIAYLYLSFQDWQHVRTGQKTLLHAFMAHALEGQVVHVATTPQHRRQIAARYGEGITLPRGDTFYEVTVALTQTLDENPAQRGFGWLLENKEELTIGMQKKFSITVRQYSPLSLLLPWLDGGR